MGQKKELFRLAVLPCLFIIESVDSISRDERGFPLCIYIGLRVFMQILNLGLERQWWFNYPGPLLDVEFESTSLSG